MDEISLSETIEAEDEAVRAGEDGGGGSGITSEVAGGGYGEAGRGEGGAPARIRRRIEDPEANGGVGRRPRREERSRRRRRGRAAPDRGGG